MSNVNSPNNGGIGNLLQNAGAIGVVVIVGFLFWPVIIPFSGTGENWKILPINWILLVAWWVLLILAAVSRSMSGHHQDHHTS